MLLTTDHARQTRTGPLDRMPVPRPATLLIQTNANGNAGSA